VPHRLEPMGWSPFRPIRRRARGGPSAGSSLTVPASPAGSRRGAGDSTASLQMVAPGDGEVNRRWRRGGDTGHATLLARADRTAWSAVWSRRPTRGYSTQPGPSGVSSGSRGGRPPPEASERARQPARVSPRSAPASRRCTRWRAAPGRRRRTTARCRRGAPPPTSPPAHPNRDPPRLAPREQGIRGGMAQRSRLGSPHRRRHGPGPQSHQLQVVPRLARASSNWHGSSVAVRRVRRAAGPEELRHLEGRDGARCPSMSRQASSLRTPQRTCVPLGTPSPLSPRMGAFSD
jgi:hypothetical protein